MMCAGGLTALDVSTVPMMNRFARDKLQPNGKLEGGKELSTDRKLAESDRVSEQGKIVRQDLLAAKVRLHRKLIDDLNLATIERMPKDELRRQIGEIVADYVRVERIMLNARELEGFATEVFDELTGLGPLEALLKDQTISDILINTHEKVFVERHGKLEPVSIRFKDEAHLLRVVNKIVSAVGRRVDEFSP